MDTSKYFVGLVVFSGIGSFLIVDLIDFGQELRKNPRQSHLYLDFLRLVVLALMAAIGFFLAKETFTKSNDWIIFLVVGAIASLAIYALGIKRRAVAKGRRL